MYSWWPWDLGEVVLGVLPLGVGGRPNSQVLGNLLNKSGLPLPSTLGQDSLHHL